MEEHRKPTHLPTASRPKNLTEIESNLEKSSRIKSELIICEYEIYAETQFVGWTIDDLGVFNKIIMYPPEKGILSKEMSQIAKEFSNSIVNKKVFLNNDNNDEEDKLKNNIENDNNKENIENKKDKEKKKKLN